MEMEAMSANTPTNGQGIDERAIDSLSVAPGDAGQDAGQDSLDEALDESMDASDPPAVTQPGRGEPAPSSGFDAAEEAERQRDA
jgi:hypothetical protein